MSKWQPQFSRSHFEYGVSPYYWNRSLNPNATFDLCLANCTTLCYGRAIENGLQAPVRVIRNASQWHLYLNDDWDLIPYYEGMQLKAGDIVQWIGANHIGTIEEDGIDPRQSSSWYTGDDGSGSSNRSYAVMGNTLQSVSNWMINNHPYRFYHCTNLSLENRQGGNNQPPDYVFRNKKLGRGFKWWMSKKVIERRNGNI